ncbi:oligoendopeptidase, pepF/M3 family [Allomeiothermus silvanus DSM 9946]|uniref:Oligoendopeptidase, pepF/M3 family n=1 Tax=Allomeiothermus silvanus (strain ATCC 700542 / DSM 9946 / NBRC 106475 / NCIMB 13440 / VI-R2) TaxID=526227 RepID=D7BBN4_ALLS1|nr:M3 family oligoendopeptidase [Allomeiothermus silvanus]ADH64496.1 oligoendopeptidase, pepF/M3 family [Allomeiothermus silvanus DSM 9946]
MDRLAELPEWDLSPLFSGLDTPDFQAAWDDLQHGIRALETLMHRHEVGQRPARSSDETAFQEIIAALNGIYEAQTPIGAYLYALTSTNATLEAAQVKLSEYEGLLLQLERLRPRLTVWLAALEPEMVEAGEYKILIEEAKVEAQHMMSEAEEILAAELSLSGGAAWAKLHGNLTSLITASVNGEELPMSSVRLLAMNPDRAVRKAAYTAELAAWEANEVALAAALNGWKGERSTLNRKRGWADDLEPTLQQNRITRQVLSAMQAAITESLPTWRRYFRAKAKALSQERLEWWDLFAPIGFAGGRRWGWEEGRRFIVEHLSAFSRADADLAERAYAERWIDAKPRKGKVGGAYCMPIGKGQSRILTNYEESFSGVSTMAHELGHAYHNLCLATKPALLRREPMTLAETASIMNETIVTEAALRAVPEAEQVTILEGNLQDAAQLVVDIHSRFLFERSVFEKRKERELSPSEFKELMLAAQQATYGDALASYHPYMWAVKGHYYGIDFYNYPYTFGLLFGLALFKKYQREGADFVAQYDDMLASVGTYPAQELADRFGFNLEDPGFWAGGLEVLAERIARFEKLVG